MSAITKGYKVSFRMKNGEIVKLPRAFGIIHDPDGEAFNKCEVFFASIRKTQRAPSKTNPKATRYFGKNYVQREAVVDVPKGPWNSIGEVVEIFYERTVGSQYAGRYFHVFKQRSPMLSKCKSTYRLALQNGCIVDDRGFVFP